MVVGTLAVLWTLVQLTPNPTADPAIASTNQSWFPWFLAFFLLRLRRDRHRQRLDVPDDPAIWRDRGRAEHHARHAERYAALLAGDQGGLRGDRHHRRGRRARRLPDPDGVRLAVGRATRVGRLQGAFVGVHGCFYVGLPAGHLVRLPAPVVATAGAAPT